METAQTTPVASEATAPRIYSALSQANREINAIAKANINQGQGFKFRGIDDVYNALHPILAKYDIFIIPEVVEVRVTERTNARGGVVRFVEAKVLHHYTTSDGSSVTTTIVGEAMDSGDKAVNKALSIALKYSLFQLFTIPTEGDNDPDAHSEELAPKGTPQQATATAPQQTPQPAPTPDELAKAMVLLQGAKTLGELAERYKSLPQHLQQDRSAIVPLCESLKAEFTAKNPAQ